MPRPKKVSMQDIADKLAISKNAVSLALSGKKGVSGQLRQEVLQAARDLGYGMVAEAGGPQRPEHAAVPVLVPERIMGYEDNDHFLFYHDLIWGLEKRLREKGFNAVILRISDEMEKRRKLPELALTLPSRGMILFGIVDRDYAEMVRQRCGPVLMFDSYHRGLPGPVVTSANIEGAYEAVSYLLDCGHTRIGFIGPTNLTTSHEERWFGYWKAMRESGAAERPDFCLLESAGFARTAEELDAFLDGLAERPTAFFCGNDRIALLLIAALRKRGIRVPEDLSVIGFDGLALSETSDPPLTTMKVDKAGMCDAAAAWLLMEPQEQPFLKWGVPAALTVRHSVAAAD